MDMSELETAWMMLFEVFGMLPPGLEGLAVVLLACFLTFFIIYAACKFALWLPSGIKWLLLFLWEILAALLHRLFGRAKDESGRKLREERNSRLLYSSLERQRTGYVNPHPRIQLEENEEKESVLEEEQEEPAREEQQEKEKQLDKNVYLERELSKKQRDELAEREYKRLKISAFGDSGASYYLVKPRWNEGKEHAFFCFLIEAELKKRGKRAELHITDGPDVVFRHKGHTYCIDVETGTNIARSREKVERKFGYYARDYHRSYIFVTKKKLKYKYSRYGIVVTRAKLKKVLKSVFD